MKENTFTKIATFSYSSEAIILKGKIESEGIEVFMFDNNTIDTDPLISNAIGGVKLFVRTENAEQGKLLVSEFNNYNSENLEKSENISDIKSLFQYVKKSFSDIFS